MAGPVCGWTLTRTWGNSEINSVQHAYTAPPHTPFTAVTGRKSKSFIEWVNLNQIQLPIPESFSTEQEEFKTTLLFEN